MEKKLNSAKKYVYNLLRIRQRSEKEILSRLKAKKFADETVKKVISDLRREGLIDDLEFAKAWIDARLRTSPKGVSALRQELTEKGVRESIIDQGLADKEVDETKMAERIVKERMKGFSGLPELTVKRRLYNCLISRGFDIDVIEDVLGKEIKLD